MGSSSSSMAGRRYPADQLNSRSRYEYQAYGQPITANGAPVMMPVPVYIAPYPVGTPYGQFGAPPPPPVPPRPSMSTDRTTSWTESRDRVYSRVLYAEEFLMRISEQNGRIQLISQLPDRHRYQSAVAEMLGLCGHLHGELIRIHRMIASEDPQLRSIAEFEVSNAGVVDALRGINRQSSLVNASTSTANGDDVTSGHRVNGGTEAATSTSEDGGTSSNSEAMQSEPIKSLDAATDMATDMEDMTEDDLKRKHNKEASEVAERYAQVLAGPNHRSVDEVNRLLAQHTETVQQLRLRQDAEKQRFNALLAAKRLERRRARGENVDDGDGEDRTEQEEITDNISVLNEWQNRIDGEFDQAAAGDDASEGTSSSGDQTANGELAEAVRRLEELRLRGQLTEEALAELLNKYLPSMTANSVQHRPPTNDNRRLKHQDSEDMRQSVSQLVQENLAKQKQLQTKRQQEKEQIEAKLQQKLREKNQRQQMIIEGAEDGDP